MTNRNPTIKQIARQIHAIEKRTINNVVETGRLLSMAQDRLDHGEWMTWLKGEFRWSYRTALRYIAVYDLSRTANLPQCQISISALYFAADASEQVRKKILARAAKQRVSRKDAVQIADDLQQPPPHPLDPEDSDPPKDDSDGDPSPKVDDAPPLPADPVQPDGNPNLNTTLRLMLDFAQRENAANVSVVLSSVDLTLIAYFVEDLAKAKRGDNPVKAAADRAEARSRQTAVQPEPAGA